MVQVKLGAASPEGFPVTALREVNTLLALKHPNIVRVREMVVGSSVDKVLAASQCNIVMSRLPKRETSPLLWIALKHRLLGQCYTCDC